MTTDQYIVIEDNGKTRRKLIWNASAPMGVGSPFRWILERTSEGVRVREIRVSKPRLLPVDSLSIDQGATLNLDTTQLTIRRSVMIRPAYRTPALPRPPTGKNLMPQLFAFLGVRRTVLKAQPIHSAYVGYLRGKPVFTFFHTPNGAKIKGLLSGFYLKLKGQTAITLTPGQVIELKTEELLTATLGRGWHWWRFNSVSLTEGPLQDNQLKGARPGVDPETHFFRKVLKATFSVIALFSLVIWIVPASPPPPEEKVAPVKTVTMTFAPRFRAPVAAAQPGSAKVEQVAEARSPAPAAPQAVPRAAPEAQKAPSVPKTPAVDVKAAAESEKLRALFSGVDTAISKTKTAATEKTTDGGARRAGGAHSPSAVALGRTDIKPGTAGGNAQVTGLGGGEGGGGGYASGGNTHGSVAGQGNSMVSLSAGGATVDEGLTKEEVGAVIHQHMNEIRYCHEAALLSNPKMEGKLILDFTISPAGRVERVGRQSSTLPDQGVANKGLEGCVSRRLVTWQFPRPKGGVKVTVSYPFLFKTLGRD